MFNQANQSKLQQHKHNIHRQTMSSFGIHVFAFASGGDGRNRNGYGLCFISTYVNFASFGISVFCALRRHLHIGEFTLCFFLAFYVLDDFKMI